MHPIISKNRYVMVVELSLHYTDITECSSARSLVELQ